MVKSYFIYITSNFTKKVLCVGVMNDLRKSWIKIIRIVLRKKKSFAGKYNCYHLVFYQEFQNPPEAILREKEIKKWRREKKIKLIEDFNPDWVFLENDI